MAARSRSTGLLAAIGPLIGAAFGCVFFLAILPLEILDPRYVKWLFRLDPATHFLGWHFFRSESWRWPPGAAWRYGEEMGSSVVYSDSIPLVAIGLKPFSGLLPSYFQYSGWWMLACYALSGFFAWRLGFAATRSNLGAALTAAFAVANPVMLDCAIGHFALVGQWVLLWSLLNYIRLPDRRAASSMPVWVASLMHSYLLLMVLAIWAAEQCRSVLAPRDSTWRSAATELALRVACMMSVLAALLWAAGYFTLPGGALGGSLYGRFAANLNGLVNPVWGSYFIPAFANSRSESAFVGFSYLGCGAIALVPVAACALLATARGRSESRPLVLLGAVALILFVVALTNQIYLGDRLLLAIPLPERVLALLGAFRASGRLAWVLFYCLLLGSVTATLRYLPRSLGAIVASAALALQLVDLAPRYAGLRGYFAAHYARAEGMADVALAAPEWNELARSYRRIHVVPMEHIAPNYLRLGLFAADHGMSINVGYFARVRGGLGEAAQALFNRARAGAWDPHTLYVINAPELLAEIRVRPEDALLQIDGLTLLAPGWRARR